MSRGGVKRLDWEHGQRPVSSLDNSGPVAGPDDPPDHHPPGPGVEMVIIGDPDQAPAPVLLGVAITETDINTETEDTEGDEAVVAAVTSHTPHLADH